MNVLYVIEQFVLRKSNYITQSHNLQILKINNVEFTIRIMFLLEKQIGSKLLVRRIAHSQRIYNRGLNSELDKKDLKELFA